MDRNARIEIYRQLQRTTTDAEMLYINTICDEHDAMTNKVNKQRLENDKLRATLATIQTEAERYPVPGGFTYAISGKLMGMVDEVLK